MRIPLIALFVVMFIVAIILRIGMMSRPVNMLDPWYKVTVRVPDGRIGYVVATRNFGAVLTVNVPADPSRYIRIGSVVVRDRDWVDVARGDVVVISEGQRDRVRQVA